MYNIYTCSNQATGHQTPKQYNSLMLGQSFVFNTNTYEEKEGGGEQEAIKRKEGKEGAVDDLKRYANLARSKD